MTPPKDLPTTSETLQGVFKNGRPLPHPLEAYWTAPDGTGPLDHEWKDKPHRLVYDLISAIVHSDAHREQDAPAAAEPLSSGVIAELKKLRREYRPSMGQDTLHSWASDLVAALDRLEETSTE